MLAREINKLCGDLTAIIEEREYFVDEIDTLVDQFMLEKTVEFMKETQGKDMEKLLKLQILGREFELRACEKNFLIEKLKGGEVCAEENRRVYERDSGKRYGKDGRVAGRGKGVPTEGSREEDFHCVTPPKCVATE
ncbi:hypothetical protein Tco_1218603 [Tanacetum coccineum]